MNKKAKARAAETAKGKAENYEEATVWADDPSYSDRPKKPHKKKIARAAAKSGKPSGSKPPRGSSGDRPPKRRKAGKPGGVKLKRKPKKA